MNTKIVHQSGVSSSEPFAPLFDNDISPLSLQGMTSSNCSGKIAPKLSFINYGGNDITSVDIYYSVNNEPAQMTSWSGELSYLAISSIVLPEVYFEVQDENELKVYFSNTNGIGDEYPANDTIRFTFDRAKEVIDNVNLTLKLDNNPEEITWDIKNSAGETVFEGGPYTVPGGFVNETIVFEEAGCYQFTIYDAAGNGLTIPGFFNLFKGSEQIIGGSSFGSSASQQFSVDLTVGMPDLSFEPQVQVYPNPLTKSGSISIHLPYSANVGISLLNQLGQKVLNVSNQYFDAGAHNLTLETGNLPQGMYFIEIQIGNELMVKKIAIAN